MSNSKETKEISTEEINEISIEEVDNTVNTISPDNPVEDIKNPVQEELTSENVVQPEPRKSILDELNSKPEKPKKDISTLSIKVSPKKIIAAVAAVAVLVVGGLVFTNLTFDNEFDKVLKKYENTLMADSYTVTYDNDYSGRYNYIYGYDVYTTLGSYDMIKYKGQWISGHYEYKQIVGYKGEEDTSTHEAELAQLYEKGGFDYEKVSQDSYKEYHNLGNDNYSALGSENIKSYLFINDELPIRYELDILIQAVKAYKDGDKKVISTYKVGDDSLKIGFNYMDLITWAYDNYEDYSIGRDMIDDIKDMSKDELAEYDYEWTFTYSGKYITEIKKDYVDMVFISSYSNINESFKDLEECAKDFDAYWNKIYDKLGSL